MRGLVGFPPRGGNSYSYCPHVAGIPPLRDGTPHKKGSLAIHPMGGSPIQCLFINSTTFLRIYVVFDGGYQILDVKQDIHKKTLSRALLGVVPGLCGGLCRILRGRAAGCAGVVRGVVRGGCAEVCAQGSLCSTASGSLPSPPKRRTSFFCTSQCFGPLPGGLCGLPAGAFLT